MQRQPCGARTLLGPRLEVQIKALMTHLWFYELSLAFAQTKMTEVKTAREDIPNDDGH